MPSTVGDSAEAATDEDAPDELLCPITYSMYRDPVRCLGDGRVYERDALLGFWRRRPLADFHGGPSHGSAAMVPAAEVRAAVARWLDEHPSVVPGGWSSRDPRSPSSQPELDHLASEIERLALVRAAAEAADGGGAARVAAALQVLALCASSVRLAGRTPRGRKASFLGVYDRAEAMGLIAGRHAYVKRGTTRGPLQPMLWYANNGFWHGGERRFLGQQTGWLIVNDGAAAPEHIVGMWRVWDDHGHLFLAPHLRCVANEPGWLAAGGQAPGAREADAEDAAADDDDDEEEQEDVQTAAEVAARLRREQEGGVLMRAARGESGIYWLWSLAFLTAGLPLLVIVWLLEGSIICALIPLVSLLVVHRLRPV
jgi:hypothetical protein